MQHKNYELIVLVNGKPIQEYKHDGKVFIEGRPNSTYSIKIKNNTNRGALAVLSVDGINVISGEPATKGSAGYVVDAKSSTSIKGFRQDMDSVGTFKFCQAGSSYCNEVGAKGNNGVIGVLIVEEAVRSFSSTYSTTTFTEPRLRPRPRPKATKSYDHNIELYNTSTTVDASDYGLERTVTLSRGIECSANALTPSASTPEPEPSFSVGTTWGEQVNDSAKRVEFNASNITHMFELYYGTKSDLKKMGVPLEKKSKMNFPSAFGKFAKPPKNWNG